VNATTRQTVNIDTLTNSTVRISISSFEYGITYNEFISVLPGARTFPFVVIDLRGDGGGDIDDAMQIVNAFLPAGTSYLMARERAYDAGAHTARTINWRPWVTEDVARPELNGKKITVLMNSGSASASEILIAALKDCRGATLVGNRSYGKGIGQIKISRRGRQTIQITFLQMRRYIRNSSGVVVFDSSASEYHEKGIPPDVIATGTDAQQLLAAVRVNEPSISQLLRLRKTAVATTPTPVAGYRIVYEE
jgi:carboxyl-terminal processing protease